MQHQIPFIRHMSLLNSFEPRSYEMKFQHRDSLNFYATSHQIRMHALVEF